MGNQMSVQFVIILTGEICLRIQFRAVREKKFSSSLMLKLIRLPIPVFTKQLKLMQNIAAYPIYLEFIHIWVTEMLNFPFFRLRFSLTFPIWRHVSRICLPKTFLYELLHLYSAFANSCPLQIDTFLFALIHSLNVILFSNTF